MHGNGSGEMIYEITNNAHAYLKAMFQGSKDPTKYGLYICTDQDQTFFTAANISEDAKFDGATDVQSS